MYDMTLVCMWRDTFIHMTWIIDTREITHSYNMTWLMDIIWHDSFIQYGMPYKCMWYDSLYIYHDALMRATGLIRICDVIYLSMWHVAFVHMTWLINVCVWEQHVLPPWRASCRRWISGKVPLPLTSFCLEGFIWEYAYRIKELWTRF